MGGGTNIRCRRRTMTTKMKSFLQEGLGLYSEARQTLLAFDGEMESLLRTAVRGREHWSTMKNHRIHSPAAGGKRGEYGWWVAVSITGQSPRHGDAEIDCGVWWSAPRCLSQSFTPVFTGSQNASRNLLGLGENRTSLVLRVGAGLSSMYLCRKHWTSAGR